MTPIGPAFGNTFNRTFQDNERKGADDRSDGDDGGKSSSGSDVDLEDLEDIADKGFAEVETLKREAGAAGRTTARAFPGTARPVPSASGPRSVSPD